MLGTHLCVSFRKKLGKITASISNRKTTAQRSLSSTIVNVMIQTTTMRKLMTILDPIDKVLMLYSESWAQIILIIFDYFSSKFYGRRKFNVLSVKEYLSSKKWIHFKMHWKITWWLPLYDWWPQLFYSHITVVTTHFLRSQSQYFGLSASEQLERAKKYKKESIAIIIKLAYQLIFRFGNKYMQYCRIVSSKNYNNIVFIPKSDDVEIVECHCNALSLNS